MAILAEGLEPGTRRRRRFVRHARRCLTCRRHARELGVAPLPRFAGLRQRAAALIPIPLLLRRAGGEGGAIAGSGFGAGVAERTASLLAAAALAGAGGATIHGIGDVHGTPLPAKPVQAAPAAVRSPAPERTRSGAAGHGLRPAPAHPREASPQRESRPARARHHKDRFRSSKRKQQAPAAQPSAPAQPAPPQPSGGSQSSGTGDTLQSHVLGAQQAARDLAPSPVAGEAINQLSNATAPLNEGLQRTGALVDQTARPVQGLLDRTGLRLRVADDGGDGFR
jgi:hypothetical protein